MFLKKNCSTYRITNLKKILILLLIINSITLILLLLLFLFIKITQYIYRNRLEKSWETPLRRDHTYEHCSMFEGIRVRNS